MMDFSTLPKTIPRTPEPTIPAIGQMFRCVLDPLFRQSGFVDSDLLAKWPEIVGPRLAPITTPCRLQWRRKKSKNEKNAKAKLVIKVDPAFLLDISHVSSLIQERVNTYFGWACIEQIVLEPNYDKPSEPTPQPPPLLDISEYEEELAPILKGIQDKALYECLKQWGARVLEREKISQ